jgi:hypothetical protein
MGIFNLIKSIIRFNKMGVSNSRESKPMVVDKYGNCTSIDQVPPIELTKERINTIIINALKSIENIKSIENLINNYSQHFTNYTVCQLIKLNNLELFNKLHNKKVVDNLVTYSKENNNITSAYFAAIESNNKTVLAWLIKNHKIWYYNYVPIVTRYYSYGDRIYAETSKRFDRESQDNYDKSDKFMAIFNIMIKFKVENHLIDFINTNNNFTNTDYSKYLPPTISYSYYIIEQMKSKASKPHITSFYNIFSSRLITEDYRLIYKNSCKYGYEELAIAMLSAIITDINVVQIACEYKLENLITTIIKSYGDKLKLEHFDYSPTNKFENNAMMCLINNNMLSIFKMIIDKFFINTGKVIPENERSNFGKYLVYCHQGNKTEFKQVLLENIIFSSDLVKFVTPRVVITETKPIVAIVLKPKIEVGSIAEPSQVSKNNDTVDIDQVLIMPSLDKSENYCEMSKIVGKIKAAVSQEETEFA